MRIPRQIATNIIVLLPLLQAPAAPLGTAITYSGRLADNGAPATGEYEVRFNVYDAASGGSQAGPVLTNVVSVSNGLFHATLDFGDIFYDIAYWLELAVRTNGSAADFTTLSPRQALTPAPYALFAPAAGFALNANAANAVRWSGIIARPPLAQLDQDNQFTVGNTFSPIADVTGLAVRRTSDGNGSADIFKVTSSDGAQTYFRVNYDGQVVWNGTATGPISGNNITSGTVAEAHIDPAIARDTEIVPAVLANDGSGSTLDADTLDGMDSSELLAAANSEARTPISSLPFTINSPGSYYVTANLTGVPGTNGITINASHVTIDLNGFELVGVPGAQSGIFCGSFRTNLAIYNGTIRSWPGGGVFAIFLRSMYLNRLRASDNSSGGLVSGPHSLIVDCQATRNQGMPNLAGISAGVNSIVKNCIANENIADGIQVSDDGTVTGCTANHNVADGIQGANDCRIVGNTSVGNGNGGDGAAIHALISSRIEGNLALDSDRGLHIEGNGSYVANNTVRANADNYAIAAGNHLNLVLSQIPENIDWPAHVTLAGTLTGTSQNTNGITIRANDVTIDLGGHALIGVPGSLNGISASGNRTNIVVRNGIVRNWPFVGIDLNQEHNCQLERLRVSDNGSVGINVGLSAILNDCSAWKNGATGIGAISGVIRNCTAGENGGIGLAIQSGTITGCTATGNGSFGIGANNSSVVNCTANLNDEDRIHATAGCSVLNNNCHNNGLAGIAVSSSNNRIEGNNVTLNERGVHVSFPGNLIIRNSARLNAFAQYDIIGGNGVGPFLTSGNIAGSSNPHANYDL